MSRKPIGDVAMSNAERCRRYRDKFKVLANAAPVLDPLLAFLTQHPDAVADGIYRRVPEQTQAIAVALKRRLWQAGVKPDWPLPTRTIKGANTGWMQG